MKIKRIVSRRWHGLSMTVDLECEHCGHVEEKREARNDRHLYKEVIPKMECINCRKTAPIPVNP
jgi:hypothetical protein